MPEFRDLLLDGRAVALAGDEAGVVQSALARLGAATRPLPVNLSDEEAVSEWAAQQAPLHAVVVDSRPGLVNDGLDTTLEQCWTALRGVAVGALIPAQSTGKVVLIAPAPDAGEEAGAGRAALENLARTLSVEWARYGITVTALAPGPDTREEELAELVCFLVSDAGDYYSGCRFDLGLIRAS